MNSQSHWESLNQESRNYYVDLITPTLCLDKNSNPIDRAKEQAWFENQCDNAERENHNLVPVFGDW